MRFLPIKKVPKVVKVSDVSRVTVFLFVVSVLATGYLLLATNSRAQVPLPPVPCDETGDPEFHSLRPYQASPCKKEKEDLALFCGNDLIVKDEIEVNRGQAKSCQTTASGKVRCSFTVNKTKNIAVDLSDAYLPIMGNTELVTNSQNQEEKLDDAQKVNEYVSWYLNGVVNRAEYPFLDKDNPEEITKLVNFSGPLNKLLPWEIQAQARIETIKRAKNERHNQIVAEGNRLKDWEGDIAPDLLTIDTTWNKKIPPLRADFESDLEYQKAINEWRGKSCAIVTVPIVGTKHLFCIENLLRPNKWANLFPYVPFSSTEDRLGEVAIENFSVQGQAGDVKVYNVALSNQKPADLFFAHMEEANELASLLQDTFVAKDSPETGDPVGGRPPQYCDLAQVRTNPGDDLFAGEAKATVSYTADFTCEFEPAGEPIGGGLCSKVLHGGACVPDSWSCGVSYGDIGCPSGYFCGASCSSPPQSCKKDVYVNLSVQTKTPLADETYSRLVEGPSSVFKRIFPKVGPGGALLGLLDIPAATKVTYSGEGLIQAGNPGNQRAGEGAELYFPHIGSLSEYFLKGIQTILRPKGFGEQILSGQAGTIAACNAGQSLGLPELPSASGACKLNNAGSSFGQIPPLPPTMKAIFEAAAEKYKIPSALLVGIMYGEGGFSRSSWNWTEENVKTWSAGCASMPACNANNPASQGPFQLFESEWNEHKDAVKVLDPQREPNRCNFLDQVFAVARKVSKEAVGHSGYPPPQSCFGIPFNLGSGGPAACGDWEQQDVNTGIRQWAGRCFSNSGSGSTGASGGDCPNDDCEKYNQCFGGSASCSSHSSFVWSVYNRYK